MRLRVRVFRFNPERDRAPRYEEYTVDVDEYSSVLDVLLELRRRVKDLAVSYSCRVGRCGSCAVMVNGIPVAACQVLARSFGDELVIEPLPGFRVIRDLVTDAPSRAIAELLRCHAYLQRSSPYVPPERLEPRVAATLHSYRQCIACGACLAACPVYTAARTSFGGPLAMRILSTFHQDPRDAAPRLEQAVLRGLYSCLTCASCYAVCPHEIPIHLGVLAMRRNAFRKGLAPPKLLDVADAISDPGIGNPLYAPRSERGEWVRGLSPSPRARLLLFAGCMASYADRESVRSLARLLEIAGVEYQVLGDREPCCGMPLLLAGDVEGARRQAQVLREEIRRRGVEVVVTPCPSCFRMLRKEYPEVLGIDLGVEVLHSSQLLLKLIRAGAIKPVSRFDATVVFHDPCDLGRHMGVFEEPREVLRSVPGLRLVEMLNGRHHRYSRCCGAGGDLRIVDPELSLRIAELRLGDIPPNAEVVAHACPTCKTQFTEAMARRGRAVPNMSIQEILLRSVVGDEQLG